MTTKELERVVVPHLRDAGLKYDDNGDRLNTVINSRGFQIRLLILDHELSDIGLFELQLCFLVGGKFEDDDMLVAETCKKLTRRFPGHFRLDKLQNIGVLTQTYDWIYSEANDSDDFAGLLEYLITGQIGIICPAMMLAAWGGQSIDEAIASVFDEHRLRSDRSNLVDQINGILSEDSEDEALEESQDDESEQ